MKYSLDKLNELSEGDQEFNASVIKAFLLETPEDLAKLKQAIENKNFELIFQSAHKIKPNADLLGLEEVRHDMSMISTYANDDQDMDEIQFHFKRASKELQNAFITFKNYLKN